MGAYFNTLKTATIFSHTLQVYFTPTKQRRNNTGALLNLFLTNRVSIIRINMVFYKSFTKSLLIFENRDTNIRGCTALEKQETQWTSPRVPPILSLVFYKYNIWHFYKSIQLFHKKWTSAKALPSTTGIVGALYLRCVASADLYTRQTKPSHPLLI